MTETRHYHNEATQAEKLEVLRDTYLNRAAADADRLGELAALLDPRRTRPPHELLPFPPTRHCQQAVLGRRGSTQMLSLR